MSKRFLNVNDRVQYVQSTDEEGTKAHGVHVGACGTVRAVFTEGKGCGETKDDPYYEVELDNGVVAHLWREEMSVIR